MQKLVITFAILAGLTAGAQTPANCQNLDCILAAVPMPTPPAAQVLAIGQRLGMGPACTLVSIDWLRPSEFKPHYTDGTSWTSFDDSYSWFLTYVCETPTRLSPREVHVTRVMPDGSMGILIGTRS